MIEDSIIKLTDDPVIQQFVSYKDPMDIEGAFCGQHDESNGKPNGWVRAIDSDGAVYEGMMTKDGHYNGWGRLCS